MNTTISPEAFAAVFGTVYAAVVARTAHENGAPISISWESRRVRAEKEANAAIEALNRAIAARA